MPVGFPSKDYDAEDILGLLQQFEASLVEKSFSSIQTYSNAIDDFIKKHVSADLEPFFRTIAQNIQMFCNDADGSIIGVHEGLRAVMEQINKVRDKIQDNFLPFLQEGSFLVHGDSELLAGVLEDCLQQNPTVSILILQGLPSGSGISLLNRLKESSIVKNNPEYLKRLLLAPDSSALRLLQHKKCNFVLLGAHAVTPHGCLVNSAGSLQLATLAKESNVAVYSLCPTFKFYLSMPRMPFSSDDLEVLGAKLPNATSTANYGARGNSTHSSHSQGSSPTHGAAKSLNATSTAGNHNNNNNNNLSKPHEDDDIMNCSNSNPNSSSHLHQGAVGGGSGMGLPLGSNNGITTATASDRLSRNSPSLQTQMQHQAISNASFSAPPPSIQISPQLHPAISGTGNLCLNNAGAINGLPTLMGRPPHPPFSLSTPPESNNSHNNSQHGGGLPPAASTPHDDHNNINNNNNNNDQTQTQNNNNNHRSTTSSAQGSVHLGPSIVSASNNKKNQLNHMVVVGVENHNHGTTSVPQISPVLSATSPFHGPFLGTAAAHCDLRTSGGTPPQQHLVSGEFNNNSTNNNNHYNHFAPICAFQLDLIGADKITHFFTEHGVVMPWSVADKISKIFLKEIQNKRKGNRSNLGGF